MKTFVVKGIAFRGGDNSSMDFQAESLDHLPEVISKIHDCYPVDINDGRVRITRVLFEGTVTEKPGPLPDFEAQADELWSAPRCSV